MRDTGLNTILYSYVSNITRGRRYISAVAVARENDRDFIPSLSSLRYSAVKIIQAEQIDVRKSLFAAKAKLPLSTMPA